MVGTFHYHSPHQNSSGSLTKNKNINERILGKEMKKGIGVLLMQFREFEWMVCKIPIKLII
jgi:hypothetical protein